MPRPYNDAVMTAAGAALLDRVRAGLAAIEFTRMAAGDGTYTADEKVPSALRERTGLKSSRNSYPLSSVSTIPDGGVKLTALFTDQDPVTGEALVSEGYHINEMGLYAKEKDADDSTEVLYSITVAAGDIGDYMPAYTGSAPVQIVQEYRAKVSDAAAVSISYAGAVMLAEDAERRFSAIEEKVEAAGGGPIEDQMLTFEEAETRENIDSGDSLGTILGKIKKFFAGLKKVAFTGSYNDLSDKPEPFSGDYADLSGKPTIPSVGNGTVTIRQAGVSKGTFTMNQSGNTTIDLTDNDTDTWRGIQDNLTSGSTTDSLSARQGNLLANGSARDETKLPLTGGTVTGDIIRAASSSAYPRVELYSNALRVYGNSSEYATYFHSQINAGSVADYRIYSGGNPGILLGGTALYILSIDGSTYKNIVCGTVNQYSSKRFKENIKLITDKESRAILRLRPVHFDYIDGDKDTAGFIAEDVEEVLPDLCTYGRDYTADTEEDLLLGLNYNGFIPYLTKLIQEHDEKIGRLEKRINGLEAKIAEFMDLADA